MVVVPNSEDVLLYPSVNWSLNIYSLQEKKLWIMPPQDVLHGPHTQPPTNKNDTFMHIIRFDKHERQVWKYDMGCVYFALSKKMVIPSTKVLWKLILDFALSRSMMIMWLEDAVFRNLLLLLLLQLENLAMRKELKYFDAFWMNQQQHLHLHLQILWILVAIFVPGNVKFWTLWFWLSLKEGWDIRNDIMYCN
jgi:hypothetical protein